MYLWSVNRLVDDFRNDKVTEKEKLKYMILLGIVGAIISDPIIWIDFKYSMIDSVNLVLVIITSTVGTYYCYTKNKSGDNNDFITRFICLGVPVGVKIFVFALPVIIFVGIVENNYGIGKQINHIGEVIYLSTINRVILGFLYAVSCFIYLGKKLNEISKKANK